MGEFREDLGTRLAILPLIFGQIDQDIIFLDGPTPFINLRNFGPATEPKEDFYFTNTEQQTRTHFHHYL